MKNVFRVELLKLRHSKILNIVIFLPLFFVILGFTNFLRYRQLFTEKGQNVWSQVYTQSSMFYGLFIIALFITIIIAILVRIENADDNFKRILTLPIKRSDLYIAKLFVACGIVALNLILLMLLIISAGVIIAPSNQSMPIELIYTPILCIIASLPVIGVQYYLSMKFKNIAVPLGVGLAFSIPSILINNTKYWMLFPWTYPGRVLLNAGSMSFYCPMYMYIISIVVFIVFTIVGLYEFNNRDV
ncbi:ABC transporter permease subunit [Clostridium sp. P21]|uniref:ABC transporter permease subunit n=1 Tax=Clostridium muellerianum TaxID=2716538 RepID=A0A7Y0EGC5_9CLOT|nr:ABC transporter permease [Clostridium muellerianum]NMM62996.1 ABC transporter permease subunit [Clostridium muellerianum]